MPPCKLAIVSANGGSVNIRDKLNSVIYSMPGGHLPPAPPPPPPASTAALPTTAAPPPSSSALYNGTLVSPADLAQVRPVGCMCRGIPSPSGLTTSFHDAALPSPSL